MRRNGRNTVLQFGAIVVVLGEIGGFWSELGGKEGSEERFGGFFRLLSVFFS